MSIMVAGKGEHRVYPIADPEQTDTGKLTARNHYIGVDAVAWFINKESNWFTDRMAAGTLDIKLAGGAESYQVALGTFALTGGSKTAPVFDRAVLPDRNYRGGPITFSATLTAIKRDTVIAGLLKSAADASLGVAAGMVGTATLAGPTKILAAAGSDILGGVRTLLKDTGEKREPLFDFSGLEFSLKPEDVIGPRSYLLLHRGSELIENNLTIQKSGKLQLPIYNGSPLEDGAWLLLRIRRSDEYSGVREWFDTARSFRLRLETLVDDFASGLLSKEDALKEFEVSSSGDKSLLDNFVRLRGVIGNDGVLAEREAFGHIAQLRLRVDAARRTIIEGNKDLYYNAVKTAVTSLSRGETPTAPIAKALLDELDSIAKNRIQTIESTTLFRRVASLDPASLFQSLQYLPDLHKEYSKDLSLSKKQSRQSKNPITVI
jgi:hypothetical protein